MSGLNDYLTEKRWAIRAQRARVERGDAESKRLEAKVDVVGRAGVRKIEIRDHAVLADSGVETGGFDLGPSPVEYLLGALGSCLAHTFLVQAAVRCVELDALSVTVSGTSNPRGGPPTDINYTLTVTSPECSEQIDAVYRAAERICPITTLLTQPQKVGGTLVLNTTERAPRFVGFSADMLLP